LAVKGGVVAAWLNRCSERQLERVLVLCVALLEGKSWAAASRNRVTNQGRLSAKIAKSRKILSFPNSD
jgi:hypothetical protein